VRISLASMRCSGTAPTIMATRSRLGCISVEFKPIGSTP